MYAIKPVIPAAVADAIERIRAEPYPYDNAHIVSLAVKPEGDAMYGLPTVRALRSIPLDTLLAALVNGYEAERLHTPTKRDLVAAAITGFYGCPTPPSVLDRIERIYSKEDVK